MRDEDRIIKAINDTSRRKVTVKQRAELGVGAIGDFNEEKKEGDRSDGR